MHTNFQLQKAKPANKPQAQQQTSSLPRPYDGNQQTTSNFSRPCEEITRKQPTSTHPDPTPVIKSPQKSPLLPTPPASEKPSNNTQPAFSRPSPVIPRPSLRNNYRFHQHTNILRPHTPEFNDQGPPLLPRP